MKNCLECTHAGRDCIPYLMTLSQADLLAWCKHRKDALNLTSDHLARRSNVPKSTVDRILSPKNTDCRFTTMQPIICTLTGCSAEELDCDNVERPNETLSEKLKSQEEIVKHLEAENARQAEYITKLHTMAKEDIERAKSEESVSIEYMKKKEKSYIHMIYGISAALVLAVVLILAALLVDKFNSDIGFFWLK